MGIAEKMADIATNMNKPQKSGYLSYADHNYSTRDDLVDVLREELSDRGIAVFPKAKVKNHAVGSKKSRAIVEVTLEFVDSESGETHTASWVGESEMSGDKATASAATQAMRFVLINTFLVSDGMVEAVAGNTSGGGGTSQNKNVHRDKPAGDPKKALANRLGGLGFSRDQIQQFGDYIARTVGVDSFDDVPAGKVQMWASRMNEAADEKARQKVMKSIDADEAA